MHPLFFLELASLRNSHLTYYGEGGLLYLGVHRTQHCTYHTQTWWKLCSCFSHPYSSSGALHFPLWYTCILEWGKIIPRTSISSLKKLLGCAVRCVRNLYITKFYTSVKSHCAITLETPLFHCLLHVTAIIINQVFHLRWFWTFSFIVWKDRDK